MCVAGCRDLLVELGGPGAKPSEGDTVDIVEVLRDLAGPGGSGIFCNSGGGLSALEDGEDGGSDARLLRVV